MLAEQIKMRDFREASCVQISYWERCLQATDVGVAVDVPDGRLQPLGSL